MEEWVDLDCCLYTSQDCLPTVHRPITVVVTSWWRSVRPKHYTTKSPVFIFAWGTCYCVLHTFTLYMLGQDKLPDGMQCIGAPSKSNLLVLLEFCRRHRRAGRCGCWRWSECHWRHCGHVVGPAVKRPAAAFCRRRSQVKSLAAEISGKQQWQQRCLV